MAALPSFWADPTSPAWNPASVADWWEDAGVDQPGSGGTYTRDDAAETIVGEVPWQKRYQARAALLGYAYTDSAGPYYDLLRVNPMFHPDELQLRVESVDCSGFNLMGAPLSGGSQNVSYYNAVNASLGGFQIRPNYTRAKLTIKYRPHPFPYLTDAQMLSLAAANGYSRRLPEYYRNTTIFESTDPVLQTIAANSEPFMEWADTPDAPYAATGPQQGTTNALEGTVPVLFSQAQLVMVWHDVPYEYIANPFLPSKIMAAIGTVNSNTNVASGGTLNAPWLGFFPRGTLKLEAPRIIRKVQSQIRTNSPLYLPFVCDVFFPFSFQDPTPAPVNGAGTPSFRGWNLFLWNFTNLWYSIRRINATTKSLFEETDFDRLFASVLA